MAHFITPLKMTPVDNGRRWRLLSPLAYASDVEGVGAVWVPSGFVCDLNSMPRISWIVSPKTDYPEAGAVHDWLYQGHATRSQADAVYREALGVLGMGRCRRATRWLALRVFGRWAYNKKETV